MQNIPSSPEGGAERGSGEGVSQPSTLRSALPLRSAKNSPLGFAASLCEELSTLHSSLVTLLQSSLSALPPTFYEGPVGVDMLVTADGRIHPCVEINFRMTMGWLALHISPFFE